MNYKYYFKFWLKQNKKELITESYSTVFEINWNELKKKGTELLVFDVDDTLSGHQDNITEKSIALLKNLQSKGFKIAFFSNTKNERKQVRKVAKDFNIFVFLNSDKPNPTNLGIVLSEMKMKSSQCAVIGDKVSTDLFTAYQIGIPNRILVTRPYSEVYGGSKPGLVYRVMRKIDNWFATNI
jgi:HAD superfamily phosphatase (TIGR01668 family)